MRISVLITTGAAAVAVAALTLAPRSGAVARAGDEPAAPASRPHEEADDASKARGEHGEEHEEEKSRVSRGPAGEVIVTFDEALQQRVGIKTLTLTRQTHQRAIEAYGRLVEDPARTFTLRAPFAGILAASTAHPWPDVGTSLDDGAVVGRIRPRLTPVERVDLATRAAAAQAEERSAAAAVDAAKASYTSKLALYYQDRVIAERSVEEAKAKLASEQARLETARQTLTLITDSTSGLADPDGGLPLVVSRGGEVVDAPVRPGESVESGQVLLQAARYDRLIARIEVPIGQRINVSSPRASISVAGAEGKPMLDAERVGPAPAADVTRQGLVMLFRVKASDAALRPGMAVVGWLPEVGGTREGVVIPRDAVVRWEGRAWAYAAIDGEKFTRREVSTQQPGDEGWFVERNFAAGDRIVVEGAESLLSEELKPQIKQEVEASE